MKIALIGASGHVGSSLRDEALARGHQVTALVSRPERLAPAAGLSAVRVDVADTDALAAALAGHDVVLSAFSGHAREDVRGDYVRGMRSVIEAARRTGLRLLVVGGAGSLEVAPSLQLVDMPDFPAAWKASAEGARDALAMLRQQDDVDWTMLCPSALLEPGERTGRFRLGRDQLLVGEDGRSRISLGDYAGAMIDEVEHPVHRRMRYTVGY